MKPVIYYRGTDFEKEELVIARQFFRCTNLLTSITKDELTIGRYSLVPFYGDQEREIINIGSKLINSYQQYRYISDLQNYVADLKDLTPKTWDRIEDIPETGAFIVKGETNSKKGDWKNSMYAPTKAVAIDICNRLSNDSLLGQQRLYVREYVPLVKLLDGVNGMPVTLEFRFFVAHEHILCGGYYWQNYIDDLSEIPNFRQVPLEFLNKVVKTIGNKCNFYVIDVAKTVSGNWIVIELNEGQSSGLSNINPSDLYSNLSIAVKIKK